MMAELFDEETMRAQDNEAIREEGRIEGVAKGRAEGEAIGTVKTLVSLVKDGILGLAEAAARADMSVEEFKIIGELV